MSHGVNRRIILEYQIYLRQTFSLECSDLKILYDRIVHISAIIALQSLGLTILEVVRMLEAIQKFSQKVITSFGDSETTYGSSHIPKGFKNSMKVLIQVNSSATQIWTILSSLIFAALR